MPPSRQDFDALILAAGFGTRLRPITNHIPKPVVPVFGIPAVVLIHDWLKRSGAKRVGINTHYLPEKLTSVLESWGVVFDRIFLEPEIRGTGGALLAFEDWLIERPLLAHNSDIFHDIHVAQVTDFVEALSLSKACLGVTTELKDFPKKLAGSQNVITSIRGEPTPLSSDKLMGYLGLQVVTSSVLTQLKKMDFPSDILTSYIDAYSANDSIGFCDLHPTVCFDIGSVAEFLSIHRYVLKNGPTSFGISGLLSSKSRDFVWVGEDSQETIGRMEIEGPSFLSNVDCEKASGHIGPNVACWDSQLSGTFAGASDCVIFEGGLNASDLPGQPSNFVYSNGEYSQV